MYLIFTNSLFFPRQLRPFNELRQNDLLLAHAATPYGDGPTKNAQKCCIRASNDVCGSSAMSEEGNTSGFLCVSVVVVESA